MTDKKAVARRFSRAVSSYDGASQVQRGIAERMIEILVEEKTEIRGPVLEIGCGTGIFSRLFIDRFKPEGMLLNDITDAYLDILSDIVPSVAGFLHGDAETAEFPDRFGTVVSCSAFQWFHDFPAFLRRLSSFMVEDAVLAFSTFGQENMKEIAMLEGPMLHYHTMGELVEVLSRDYDVYVAEEDRITLYFSSATDILRHLKDTGVTGDRKRFWTRSHLESFGERYSDLFGSEKGLALTYHPIWVLARRR